MKRYKSKLWILKFVRTRVVIGIIVLIVILICDLILHWPVHSSLLQDVTSADDLIPDMHHKSVINSFSSPSVVLTVFYECLCADSKSFFKNHLLPAVLKEPKLIKTNLVPYGKAKTEVLGSTKYKFTCQHGDIECLGNKFHACLINEVEDHVIQLQIITCMIEDNFSPLEISRKCCKQFNIPWRTIEMCALGKKGNLLLKEYGEKTNELFPKVSFIPTILLNESRDNQAGLLKNLWKEICTTFKTMALKSEKCTY